MLLYDGACGLCHHAVRFTLRHDAQGRFDFAPLGGLTARERLAEVDDLPDSLVLLVDGVCLVRSHAVARILMALGGPWRGLGRLVAAFPPALADAAYDAVARVRHRWFAPPPEACPRVPPALQGRFLP